MVVMERSDINIQQIRKILFNKLKERNTVENRFAGIIKLCNVLHESVDFLQIDNCRLRSQNVKLEQATENQHRSEDDVIFNSLKKRIYELQQELTEVHRSKGEHADTVIELQKALDDNDKEIQHKSKQIEQLQNTLKDSESKRMELEDKTSDVERALQLLNDEYSTLYITFTSLQKAESKLRHEHENLLVRWQDYKVQLVEELNKENEVFQQLKHVKMKKDMEEAIKEPIVPSSSRYNS